jgi:hypothetical protein
VLRKERIRPTLMIPATPSPTQALTLAQDAAQAHTDPAVDRGESRSMTVLKVLEPPDQCPVDVLDNEARMKSAVQRAFQAIVGQYQRIRPNRSYVRRSMRPETKWHPSKEKKRDQKAAASLAPA